jgi:amino acid transporter
MVIAYGLVCTCVWAVLQSLAEMTIAFPVSGNFIDYIDRWVDPALAFGAGFAEWLGWVAVIGAEATFFNVLIQYWADGSFPEAASSELDDLQTSAEPLTKHSLHLPVLMHHHLYHAGKLCGLPNSVLSKHPQQDCM